VLRALARAELRRGRSVVLDGVAQATEIQRCDRLARDERARLIIVLMECPDPEAHRARVEGRSRRIPDWYELTWGDVERSRARWTPPARVDLRLDSTMPLESNMALVADVLRVD
jgi:hypothetical protein